MKTVVITLSLLIILVSSALAQSTTNLLTETEKTEAVEKICQLLDRFYVLPEVATLMEKHLRTRLAEGAFEQATDPEKFAEIATRELRSINKDKHLFVFLGSNPDEQTDEERILKRAIHRFDNMERNHGLNKVEILSGNIGYLSIKSVMYSEDAMTVLSAAMEFLSNTEAIIFDLRINNGGDPVYMTRLFSYFFDKPTHINSVYWRHRDRTDEFWTHEMPSGKKMTDIPLFVLISARTFSGAEEFAYDLQALKRAALIGEVSAGGANPAQTWVVYEDIRISIPYGRAVNPITGTNWEGVGVKPDIEVSADKALEVAVEKARDAASKYHETQKAKLISAYGEYNASMQKAARLLEEGNIEEAEAMVSSGLSKAVERDLLNQSSINELGYDHLGRENTLMAIAVFKFNVNAFPESADVYDSLGEAYVETGQNQLAIDNYRKALEIDPKYATAIRALEELGAI